LLMWSGSILLIKSLERSSSRLLDNTV